MGVSTFIRASIALLAAIVTLYIMEITFGATMDSLYISFYNITTNGGLHLSSAWVNIAVGTLGGWVWFFRSFLVAIIAIGVWVVESIIIEVDYGRSNVLK